MAERGIDEIHFDLCWQAVVSEELDFQEREDWADLLGMDEDDAGWEAQAMRIAFARKLGFKAVGMDDECESIAVLPEFITLEAATEEDDEEEDDEEDEDEIKNLIKERIGINGVYDTTFSESEWLYGRMLFNDNNELITFIITDELEYG